MTLSPDVSYNALYFERVVAPMSTNRAKESVMSSTAVVCGECGKGNFRVDERIAHGDYFTCTVCPAEVTWDDIVPNLDDGQDAFVFLGIMRVTDDAS